MSKKSKKPKLISCPSCRGSGVTSPAHLNGRKVPCRRCEGSGRISRAEGV